MSVRFEWDKAKAASNVRKHGIEFSLAIYAFEDPLLICEQDRVTDGEERWQTLGVVEGHLLLLVAHTIRELDEDGETVEIVRIISARRAGRKEWRRYGEDRSV